MSFSRARYVVICQQFLVTATVLAVGLSAAGVMTLQIVAPEQPAAADRPMRPAVHRSDETYVATEKVTPKVRQVAVAGVDSAAAENIPGLVTAPAPPEERTAAPEKPKKLAALTAPEKVRGYATVGVTWEQSAALEDDEIAVQVRTRKDGRWSGWTSAEYHDEHGPNADSAEGRAVRPGTDAVVVGDVDEVQMKAETADGSTPPGMKLAVIDPGTDELAEEEPAINPGGTPTDESAAEELAEADLDLQASTSTPRPTIYSRAQWGANERMRDGSSLRYGTIKAGFIHHTVNANGYSREQVPSLIRGIYAYHTQSRGWSDIGYNFLVDRFGRIWEGRYGGAARPVVGAHTLGYNEVSFAMSAIGNFDVASAPAAVQSAYAKLFAWKLSLYGINAADTSVYVKNRNMRAINGHRDAGSTACPGRYLYAKIPDIRAAARKIQLAAAQPADPVDQPVLGAPANVPSPTATPRSAVPQPAVRLPAWMNMAGTHFPDVVTKSDSGAVRITPTEGMVGFRAPVQNTGGWGGRNRIAAVGDVTGDGRGDILARTSGSRISRVYAGDGQGRVSSRAVPGTGTYAFRRVDLIVGVGDWDRDGRYDVISRSRRSGALFLHRGKAGGKFATATRVSNSWPYTRTSGVGDFNGDGRLDLMGQRSNNDLVLIAGRSGTTTSTALRAPVTVHRLGDEKLVGGWGDLTDDGRADLLIRNARTGLVSILSGSGNGRVGQVYGPFDKMVGVSHMSMGPMSRSRHADFVGRDSAGRLFVIAHNGRRNLSGMLPGNLSVPVATQVLNVGDWDRDGHGDVITREYSGQRLVLRRGLGNGKFTRGRSLGNGWESISRLSGVGDVTGDGYPDLMGRIGNGRLLIWPGYGLRAFKPVQYAPGRMRTYNQIGTSAWETQPGAMHTSTTGTFVPATGSGPYIDQGVLAGSSKTYDQIIGIGDVNWDGLEDVIAREKSTGVLWLLPGKTSGGFGDPRWVAAGFAGYQLIG